MKVVAIRAVVVEVADERQSEINGDGGSGCGNDGYCDR